MKRIILTALLLITISTTLMAQDLVIPNNLEKKWWKEAVIYQIYPRSFKDSNGDGIGDLRGIISSLDYIKSLGITAVWLGPIYQSPNDDNGYDISDYRNIMTDFGTMEDYNEMLKGFHDRGIKVIMDLVFNHSSDEHQWFQESKKSRDNPYRDYYYWWPAEKGTPPYRWSWFDVNSNAWKYDATTDSYYLHYFSQKQPDLNWNNPKLRNELYDIMRFWLDKGVDGFRMDAFQFISKDPSFPEIPMAMRDNPFEVIKFYGNGPHLHDYIQEMNREVLSKYDVMTVSEGAGDSPAAAMKFVDPERKELNMAYHFESVDIGNHILDYGLVRYKEMFGRWDETFKTKGWLSIFMSNHDQPRMVSKFGNDSPEFREVSAKMLTTFVMTMRGTPYYLQGDELGMVNIRFNSIEEYNDVDTRNKYAAIKNKGGDLQTFLEGQKQTSRENSRTPFQWNADANAGFTSGKPWLKVNPNYSTLNAAAQQKNPESVVNYFKRLTSLRKNNPILTYGEYEIVDLNNPSVYAYTRSYQGKKWLIALNFTDKKAKFQTNDSLKKAAIMLGNYAKPSLDGSLLPYEAIVVELKN
jgi:oligo-1,6-glucosidase